MNLDLLTYIPELLSVAAIAIFMAISPGADFVMITRNSIFYSRTAGLYSALGISLAIWVHVAYSIAGLAVIISNSIILFSVVKYLGAAYLIYIGWKTFRANTSVPIVGGDGLGSHESTLSKLSAFKIGFITNALNPKTTIFFLSIFTQVVDANTPLGVQILFGLIISLAHLLWFSLVAVFLSQPVLLKKFESYKSAIEKVIGSLLIAFGLKVASTSQG